METERTYLPFTQWKERSAQKEYTQPTPLLSADGTLLAKGWARRNVFEYDRSLVKHGIISRKEWDFYQISDGKCMLQLNFANITAAGYVSAKFVNLRSGETIADCMELFFGGDKKHIPPAKGDVPNRLKDKIGSAEFDFHTMETERTLWFSGKYKGKRVECNLRMEILPGLENTPPFFPLMKSPPGTS